MLIKRKAIAAICGFLCINTASVGAAYAAAAPQITFGGPNIPGVCILNQQAVFNTSKVGVFANAHYKQMHDGAQTAVNAEEAKIVADAKALQVKKLQGSQLQQAQQQLTKRFADLRAKAAKDSQALEATRQGAAMKISDAAQPIIKQVYDQKKCGLLLARSSVLAGNGGMDITNAVIQGLDAKITTIPLDQKVAAAPKH
ncbi:MAG TPA: OmpH family outer membrane protein [Rhizomicrobium sp.]|nr:OmpH family outer membrane protein [Rhizomicrobium sp.]